jgi:hypothetical protein
VSAPQASITQPATVSSALPIPIGMEIPVSAITATTSSTTHANFARLIQYTMEPPAPVGLAPTSSMAPAPPVPPIQPGMALSAAVSQALLLMEAVIPALLVLLSTELPVSAQLGTISSTMFAPNAPPIRSSMEVPVFAGEDLI